MATNKQPVKPAAKSATSMVKWQDEVAGLAAQAAEAESGVGLGRFISVKSGVLSFNGNPVPGNKMNVVVIDSVLENHYYTENYSSDNPASPVCFAFGRGEAGMAPHEKSTEPQNDTCKGCPQNEYGTASVGKGKACKNVRRLSLIPEGALSDVEGAEVAYLKVPVTSVKQWAGYVSQLNSTLKIPPFCAITEISVVPDPKTQLKVNFKLVEQIDDEETIKELLAKRKAGAEAIMFPYAVVERKETFSRAAPRKFKGTR